MGRRLRCSQGGSGSPFLWLFTELVFRAGRLSCLLEPLLLPLLRGHPQQLEVWKLRS